MCYCAWGKFFHLLLLVSGNFFLVSFFFPYMVSLNHRALGKLVIFLYFSRSGSFFSYPCLISASRRVKHFKKIPNSSNIEYFWRSQGGHLPPLGPPWLCLWVRQFFCSIRDESATDIINIWYFYFYIYIYIYIEI